MAKAQKRSSREGRKAKAASLSPSEKQKSKQPRYLQGTDPIGPGELLEKARGKK